MDAKELFLKISQNDENFGQCSADTAANVLNNEEILDKPATYFMYEPKQDDIDINGSIKIKGNKTIYIDPFKINENSNDADLIFVTHDHYDHYSEEDIDKVKNNNTVVVAPKDLLKKLLKKGIDQNNIMLVEPGQVYEAKGIKFRTVPAYNLSKLFHPKGNNWVGYIIEVDGVNYYIAGDTDLTNENKQVRCDVAFVPVGGTYTMNYTEAAELVNNIKPKVAVPIHYGSIVGTKQDAEKFISLLNEGIQGKIIMK